jgi:hypothetical protein
MAPENGIFLTVLTGFVEGEGYYDAKFFHDRLDGPRKRDIPYRSYRSYRFLYTRGVITDVQIYLAD